MEASDERLPEEVTKRLELFRLFYPLERKYERRYGRIFDAGFDVFEQEFQELGRDMGYTQETVTDRTAIWRDMKRAGVECMFCLIDEASDLDQVTDVFNKIKRYQPVVTYAIVHQKKDGEGVYDIFRHSRFSYLEHCNRVRARRRGTSGR